MFSVGESVGKRGLRDCLSTAGSAVLGVGPPFGVPISLSAVDPALFSALLLGDSTSSESIIAVWPVLTVRQARLYAAERRTGSLIVLWQVPSF